MREPFPLAMNTGSPPTARKARTGEFTPPGIRRRALAKSSADFVRIQRLPCAAYHLTASFSCQKETEYVRGCENLEPLLLAACPQGAVLSRNRPPELRPKSNERGISRPKPQ